MNTESPLGAARAVRIVGIRGVPAAHGGFETFAERLAPYLVDRGWRVTVYCQEDGEGPLFEDEWRGVRRIHIPVKVAGAAGTVLFDWYCTVHAARTPGLVLTLGYNTAAFSVVYRARRIPNVINMDGIEWRRQKWGAVAKSWFWANDWAGCWLGNRLVADNPGIEDHLRSRVRGSKITMIPYGADELRDEPEQPVRQLGLVPGRYWTVIARPEPENSLLEIVSAFSRHPRGVQLAVLGNYDAEHSAYHRAVRAAASNEVLFLGAIYDTRVVHALRFHAAGYLHGHRVGGTNPSLVEALGAANPVIAHDNVYNRWVAGDSALYFLDQQGCAAAIESVMSDPARTQAMRQGSLARFRQTFQWPQVLGQYESLLGTASGSTR